MKQNRIMWIINLKDVDIVLVCTDIHKKPSHNSHWLVSYWTLAECEPGCFAAIWNYSKGVCHVVCVNMFWKSLYIMYTSGGRLSKSS